MATGVPDMQLPAYRICCVCLDVVDDPQTLQECLHTLCKSCMQQLMQEQNHHPPGVNCPICRIFSGKDKIMSNYFIKELKDVHKSAQEENVLCKQCHDEGETVKASCRCLDCRETLCESCKKGHKKIKLLRGHRIVDLTDDQEVVVDQLVCCDIHNDKMVELYCEPCQQLICITCKVTKHNVHPSQTIDEALDKIIPEMEENANAIDENIHEIKKSAESVQQKINETKESFQKCYLEISATAEARKREIEAVQRKMEADLQRKETEEIAKLEDMQERLELRRKERDNIRRVLRGSMERARHASLLRELVHCGLRDKVQDVKNNPEPPLQLKVNKPQFSSNLTEWTNLTEKGLLGNVVYSVMSLLSGDYVLGVALSEVKNVDFRKYFSQTFKKVKTIQATGQCWKITIINDAIWAPLNNQNKVVVFNKNGNYEKTVEIITPVSVAQAGNGDVFIACNRGLYIMIADDTPKALKTGSFADVYSHAGKVFALEYESKTITEYLPAENAQNSSRDVKLRWRPGREWKIGQVTSQYDKLVVTGVDEYQIFLSNQDNSKICEYNTQGKCVKQFGNRQETGDGNLQYSWLCGVDRQSHLLVADQNNTVYKILDPGTGQWRSTGVSGDKYVYDAKIDSEENLWLCQYDGKNYLITKHEPQ